MAIYLKVYTFNFPTELLAGARKRSLFHFRLEINLQLGN